MELDVEYKNIGCKAEGRAKTDLLEVVKSGMNGLGL